MGPLENEGHSIEGSQAFLRCREDVGPLDVVGHSIEGSHAFARCRENEGPLEVVGHSIEGSQAFARCRDVEGPLEVEVDASNLQQPSVSNLDRRPWRQNAGSKSLPMYVKSLPIRKDWAMADLSNDVNSYSGLSTEHR